MTCRNHNASRGHISIRGEVFDKLREYCEQRDWSVGSLVEYIVQDITGKRPVRRRRRGGAR